MRKFFIIASKKRLKLKKKKFSPYKFILKAIKVLSFGATLITLWYLIISVRLTKRAVDNSDSSFRFTQRETHIKDSSDSVKSISQEQATGLQLRLMSNQADALERQNKIAQTQFERQEHLYEVQLKYDAPQMYLINAYRTMSPYIIQSHRQNVFHFIYQNKGGRKLILNYWVLIEFKRDYEIGTVHQ